MIFKNEEKLLSIRLDSFMHDISHVGTMETL